MLTYDDVIQNVPSLSAYWPLYEAAGSTAADLVSGADGTYQNTPLLGLEGPTYKSLTNLAPQFRSSQSEYVSLPSGWSNWETTGRTIEMWVMPTEINANEVLLDFGNGNPSNNIRISRDGSTDDLKVQVYNGTTASTLIGPDCLTPNVWNHIVVIFREAPGSAGAIVGDFTIWHNGLFVVQGDLYVPVTINRTQNYIGRGNGGNYFGGLIARVAIYDEEFSATDGGDPRILSHYGHAIDPTRALALCDISFENPAQVPAWSNQFAYLVSFDISRGRQMDIGRIEAGTAKVILNNLDRRWEPEYSSGPYYPDILPMRRIRLRAAWNNVVYPLFNGFIRNWRAVYPSYADSYVELECVDAMAFLAAFELNVSLAEAFSGERIDAVLDEAGWPSTDRDLDTGKTLMAAETFEAYSASTHVLECGEGESGVVWAGKNGYIIFRDSDYRLLHTTTSRHTFGEQETPYRSAEMDYDVNLVLNEIIMTREGGTPQVAEDAVSQAKYFKRSYSKSLKVANDGEAYIQAWGLLERRREPQLRFKPIEIDPMVDPETLWPLLLDLDINDKITIRKRPPGGGAMIEKPVWIEGETCSYGVSEQGIAWLWTYRTSPADTNTYWELGDTTYGVLDTTTKVGY